MTSKVEAAPKQRRDTTVGNYFVANYPPFSFWSREHVPEAHDRFERSPQPGTAG